MLFDKPFCTSIGLAQTIGKKEENKRLVTKDPLSPQRLVQNWMSITKKTCYFFNQESGKRSKWSDDGCFWDGIWKR